MAGPQSPMSVAAATHGGAVFILIPHPRHHAGSLPSMFVWWHTGAPNRLGCAVIWVSGGVKPVMVGGGVGLLSEALSLSL